MRTAPFLKDLSGVQQETDVDMSRSFFNSKDQKKNPAKVREDDSVPRKNYQSKAEYPEKVPLKKEPHPQENYGFEFKTSTKKKRKVSRRPTSRREREGTSKTDKKMSRSFVNDTTSSILNKSNTMSTSSRKTSVRRRKGKKPNLEKESGLEKKKSDEDYRQEFYRAIQKEKEKYAQNRQELEAIDPELANVILPDSKMSTSFETEIKELKSKVRQLTKENVQLKQDNQELEQDYLDLDEKYEKLRRRNDLSKSRNSGNGGGVEKKQGKRQGQGELEGQISQLEDEIYQMNITAGVHLNNDQSQDLGQGDNSSNLNSKQMKKTVKKKVKKLKKKSSNSSINSSQLNTSTLSRTMIKKKIRKKVVATKNSAQSPKNSENSGSQIQKVNKNQKKQKFEQKNQKEKLDNSGIQPISQISEDDMSFVDIHSNSNDETENSNPKTQEVITRELKLQIDPEDYDFDSNDHYQAYIDVQNLPEDKQPTLESSRTTAKGKVINQYSNGRQEQILTNGSIKEIFEDGYQVIHFNNEDVRQDLPDKVTMIYYFADKKTTEFTFQDTGLKIIKFENGQVEFHYSDGLQEIK